MTRRPCPRGTPMADIPPHHRGPLYEEWATAELLANFDQDREAWLAGRNTDPTRIPFGNSRTNYGIRGHVSPRATSKLPTQGAL